MIDYYHSSIGSVGVINNFYVNSPTERRRGSKLVKWLYKPLLHLAVLALGHYCTDLTKEININANIEVTVYQSYS